MQRCHHLGHALYHLPRTFVPLDECIVKLAARLSLPPRTQQITNLVINILQVLAEIGSRRGGLVGQRVYPGRVHLEILSHRRHPRIAKRSRLRRILPAGREQESQNFCPLEASGVLQPAAINAGANVKVVQRLLGHKTAVLTLDRYGHLFPDDLDAVAAAFDAAARTAADWLRTGPQLKAIAAGPDSL